MGRHNARRSRPTCCQAQLDNNVKSQLYERIDLILTFGNVEAQRAMLFGATQATKAPSGLALRPRRSRCAACDSERVNLLQEEDREAEGPDFCLKIAAATGRGDNAIV